MMSEIVTDEMFDVLRKLDLHTPLSYCEALKKITSNIRGSMFWYGADHLNSDSATTTFSGLNEQLKSSK